MRKKATDHLGKEYATIKEMCDAYLVEYDTYYARISRGMSVEQALTGNFFDYHNELEKAEKRRAAFAEGNRGEPLVFPFEIKLSEVKPESYYERKAGIYSITNLKNGKVYIGQALHLYERLHEHKIEPFYKNKNQNVNLNIAIREDGCESFVCRILTAHDPTVKGIENILNKEEQQLIEQFDTFSPIDGIGNGYNMTLGGQGVQKIRLSDEKLNELIKDYTNGMTYRDMQAKYEMCDHTIRGILDDNGVPRREVFSTERDKEICRLFSEGIGVTGIARQTGYSLDQVQTSLNRNNVERPKLRRKTNSIYPEMREFYPQLEPIKDEVFENYKKYGLRKTEDIYFKQLKVKPKTRTTVEHLLKSFLIERGGFDITKVKAPKVSRVYLLNGEIGGKVLLDFENVNAAARFLSEKLGKTSEQCRSNISAALNQSSLSKKAYGFVFTRKISPEQALDYVLGNSKTQFSRKYGSGTITCLLEEYHKEPHPDPVAYFNEKVRNM